MKGDEMLKPLERGELDIDYKEGFKPGPFKASITVSHWDLKLFIFLLGVLVLAFVPFALR